jgi:hypothetical protein
MRANRLKMNASPDELMAIAKYSAGLWLKQKRESIGIG